MLFTQTAANVRESRVLQGVVPEVQNVQARVFFDHGGYGIAIRRLDFVVAQIELFDLLIIFQGSGKHY